MNRRSQRAARGAAMVESLVVISVMILFFLGMVFFHSMYGQKLRAMTLARSATVAHAMNACGDSPSAYIQAELNGAITTSVPQPGGNFNVAALSAPQMNLSGNSQVADWLSKMNFTVELTTEMDVTAHGGVQAQDKMTLVGFQSNPSTASFALCGDTEQAGNYPNIVQNISIHDAFPF